jgi:hypothetical protein
MKRLSIITFFAFLILTFAGATSAQVKGKKPKSKLTAPRTVEDFYKILPVKYFPYLEYEPKNRASLMGSYSIANGYLSFDNNRPIQPINGQILLLKRMSGVSMLAELLTFMNDKRRIEQSHRAYLKFARVGAGNDFAGADLSSDWYARNLKIYANITRLAESKDERIFVIIGSGHLKHLQQFVTDSGEYDLERLSKYL